MRVFIKIFLMFTLVTSSLASEAFAATNITKIEETAKSIFVELSKAKELGTVDK